MTLVHLKQTSSEMRLLESQINNEILYHKIWLFVYKTFLLGLGLSAPLTGCASGTTIPGRAPTQAGTWATS